MGPGHGGPGSGLGACRPGDRGSLPGKEGWHFLTVGDRGTQIPRLGSEALVWSLSEVGGVEKSVGEGQ